MFDATPPLSGSTQRPSRTRASARIARAANPDAAAISPKTINSKKTASARSALFCGPTTPEAGDGIPEQTPSSPSSPKELLQGNTKCRRDSLAPATPAQAESKDAPWFNLMDRAKVQAVRDVLQTSTDVAAEALLCRKEQLNELCSEMQCHMSDSTAASLYISGPPGTGKSFTASLAVRECHRWAAENGIARPSIVWINCMSLGQPRHIFQRMLEGFKSSAQRAMKGSTNPIVYPDASSSHTADGLSALRKLVSSNGQTPNRGKKGGTLIAVLDEIDSLVTADQGVLSELFMLTAATGSRLILMGISNSIDLTERTLPHLSKLGVHVGLTPFTAYSSQSLLALLLQRLSKLPGDVFQPAALDFASRKIGSNSGDLRQLLQVAGAAIDAAEEDARKARSDSLDSGDVAVAPATSSMIGIRTVATAVARLQGSCGVDGAIRAIRQLSREQQSVLCSAARLLGNLGKGDSRAGGVNGQSTGVTPGSAHIPGFYRQRKSLPGTPFSVGKLDAFGGGHQRDCLLSELHTTYLSLCSRVQIPAMNLCEFNSVCSNLSDQALIHLGNHKIERNRRVALKVCEDDIVTALQDISLFRRMLEGY